MIKDEQVGAILANQADHAKRLRSIEETLEEIKTHFDMARGGFKVFLWIAGALISVTTLINHIWSNIVDFFGSHK